MRLNFFMATFRLEFYRDDCCHVLGAAMYAVIECIDQASYDAYSTPARMRSIASSKGASSAAFLAKLTMPEKLPVTAACIAVAINAGSSGHHQSRQSRCSQSNMWAMTHAAKKVCTVPLTAQILALSHHTPDE